MIFHDLLKGPADVVACDPGQSGAVVRLGKGKLTVCRGFKTLPEIAAGLEKAMEGGAPSYLVVEDVHAMPGQGVVSMFSFGKSTGVFYGAAYSLCLLRTGLQLDEVSPQKWQNWVKKTLGLVLAAGEFDSRAIIEKYLPEYADLFRKPRGKLCDGACDAALIGFWRLSNSI